MMMIPSPPPPMMITTKTLFMDYFIKQYNGNNTTMWQSGRRKRWQRGRGGGGIRHRHQTISTKPPSMYQLCTVHTPYPWGANSYSYSIGKRRGRCSGIIIICMGPIGRSLFIVPYTILIATRHHHHESRKIVTLSSVYQAIHTNTAPLYYRTTTSIT